MPLDPNIVMGIKPFTPPDLAAIRQAGDERIHQNRVNKSNLQTADLNRRAAESNLAKSNQDIQLGVLKSMVLDAGAVRKLMGSSDVVPELNQHIGATLANLVSRTERIGGDPSLWKRWAMLDTTDRSAAMEFYDKVLLRIFEAENPELFKSEILSDSDVTAQGQVIRQGPDGGLSAMDVDNFKGAPQESFATEMRGGVPVQVSSTSGREFESPRVTETLGGSVTERARLEKIANAERQLVAAGLPQDVAKTEAQNVVDGLVRFDVTEQGRVLKINEITGQTIEMPIGGGQASPSGASEENTSEFSLFGSSNEISGPLPASKALAAKVSSMFGIEAFPETVTNRQIASGATQGLVRSLSINDQYPVREMERIRNDLAQIGPALFSGGPEVRAKMKGLHMLLTSVLNTARRDVANPELPTEMRGGAARAANDVNNFLGLMGYTDGELLKTVQDARNTPLSSLREFVRISDNQELLALDDDVEEEIFQRLSRGRE